MSPDILLKQAIDFHRRGQLEQADGIYAYLAGVDGRNARIPYLRALIAQDKGDFDRAVSYLQAAIRIDDKTPELHFELGKTFALADRLPPAKASYLKALSLAPDYVDALSNLAGVLARLGETDQAFARYDAAQALADLPEIHFNRGTLYLRRFQPELALPCFEKAVQLRAEYPAAHNSLGVACAELGLLEKARDAFRQAHEHAPDFTEPLFNLHGVLLDLGCAAEAVDCIGKLLEIAPTNAAYRFFAGIIHLHAGDRMQAEDLLRKLEDDDAVDAEMQSLHYLRATAGGLAIPPLVGTGAHAIRRAISAASVPGLILEFGVFNGKSIRQIAALANQTVHGFDSFEGIPDEWSGEAKGSYSAQGRLPEVPGNVVLHKGWFEDTIPGFIACETAPLRFANIDCDLYSSTRTILDLLAPRVIPGTVLLFDEFIGYATWQEDEFKAFHEAVERFGWRYEVLFCSFLTKQVAVRIV